MTNGPQRSLDERHTIRAVYVCQSLGAAADAVAVMLAMAARRRELTVYAGAGVSAAAPAEIPGAGGVAERIRLKLAGHIDLSGVASGDLAAIADVVVASAGGEDLLRRTLLEVVELLGRPENYAHRVLGLLLCEGVATVIETNYDDCIELGAQPERPTVVCRATELLDAHGACLLKVHGCATQPSSLVVTTAELAEVPPWATTRVAAQLHQDQVLFLGIGSVADYVREIISGLTAHVGAGHLTVVDPVLADWDSHDLDWKHVLPNLDPDRRISRSADDFCDDLLRAYAMHELERATAAVVGLDDDHPQRRGVEHVRSKAETLDGVSFVRWLRRAATGLDVGAAAVGAPSSTRVLLALGALEGPSTFAGLRPGGIASFDVDGRSVAVLALAHHDGMLGSRSVVEASRRVHDARSEGRLEPGVGVIVVSVGHLGPLTSEVPTDRGSRLVDVLASIGAADAAPEHLVASPMATSIIDGPLSGGVWMLDGDRLIEAA